MHQVSFASLRWAQKLAPDSYRIQPHPQPHIQSPWMTTCAPVVLQGPLFSCIVQPCSHPVCTVYDPWEVSSQSHERVEANQTTDTMNTEYVSNIKTERALSCAQIEVNKCFNTRQIRSYEVSSLLPPLERSPMSNLHCPILLLIGIAQTDATMIIQGKSTSSPLVNPASNAEPSIYIDQCRHNKGCRSEQMNIIFHHLIIQCHVSRPFTAAFSRSHTIKFHFLHR